MSELNVVVKVNLTRKVDFFKYVERIAKACVKVGVKPLTTKTLYKIQEEKIVMQNGKRRTAVEYYDVVELLAETPIIAGYHFIARLDFEAGKKNPMIACVPGEEIPATFFDAKPTCDHCHSLRARKTVYILQHTDGSFIQVGSTCLCDFLGHGNIEETLKLIGLFGSANSFAEGGGGRLKPWEMPVEKIEMLTDIVKIAEEFGYVSRKMCENNERLEATSDKYAFGFWYFMHPKEQLTDSQKKIIELMKSDPTQKQKEMVGAIIAALDELQSPQSAYEHNLINLRDADFWMLKDTGLVASMIPFTQIKINQKSEKKDTPISNYVGMLSQRRPFMFTLNKIMAFESAWGINYLHTGVDEHGNAIVFYAQRQLAEEQKTFEIVGTIKDHKEYKTIKQTVLNRVKKK